MPVFTLSKYDQTQRAQAPSDNSGETENAPEGQESSQSQQINIQATDSVSSIVARSLWKVLSQREDETQEQMDKSTHTQVLSTEDINRDPVMSWRQASKADSVIVVNEGFKTDKEEWFLSNLEHRGVKVFYSVESYKQHLKKEGWDL